MTLSPVGDQTGVSYGRRKTAQKSPTWNLAQATLQRLTGSEVATCGGVSPTKKGLPQKEESSSLPVEISRLVRTIARRIAKIDHEALFDLNDTTDSIPDKTLEQEK